MDTEAACKARFAPDELLWRINACGRSGAGNPWVQVLCYVDARAVQDRLDTVFGWDGWQNEYTVTPDGILCTLRLRSASGAWITKTDGSPETAVEAFKGGISKALVRTAASGLGIGRYLYGLKESFATVMLDKPSRADEHAYTRSRVNLARRGQAEDFVTLWWLPPPLPQWAIPSADDAAALQACSGPTAESEAARTERHGNARLEDMPERMSPDEIPHGGLRNV